MSIQILPKATNLGEQFGNAVGQGLQRGGEQGFQRNLLRQGLSKAQEAFKQEKASPADKALAFINSVAGIPGSERYVGPVLDLLLRQQTASTAQNIPGLGSQNNHVGDVNNMLQNSFAQGQQSPSEQLNQNQFFQQQNQLPEPMLRPDPFAGTLDPTQLGLGPIPAQYSPEQILQVEKEDALLPGGSLRSKLMQQYNEQSREKTRDIVAAAQAQSDVAERSAQRQENFRELLRERIGDQSKEDYAVAERIREELPAIANDALTADQVAKKFEVYKATKDGFKAASYRPSPFLHSRYEDQIKNIKTRAEPLLKYGQRSEVYKELAENGWSESEISKILNPLPQSIKKSIDVLPNLRSPGASGRTDALPGTKAQEDYKKNLSSVEKILQKSIVPDSENTKNADAIKPGTSLILLRNEFLKKGISSFMFDNILNNLIREGKVEIGPLQQKELQMLSQSPERVLSLYEFIFGA
jgi:hypothetical protein